ncbi:cobalamin biosynthesis protein CobD [Xylophilus rhododendri]|uniref:Cobalamin biosynthesis protein CobD n=1 Tax=Xylophilus rhododendri TaxID=2697032 RepID=A0A857J1B8_9BURK|nr:adenosylcobinamide-phosphate synthase CbiB [Xylophilus rhododendri]QHI97043.1 cobalamin biosynthesis protein CobD [Xylophilus rhododendri]
MSGLPWAVAALAVLLALGVDIALGEPRRWHPVVGMGRYLGWAGRRVAPLGDCPPGRDMPAFWRGAAAWFVGGLACVLIAWAVQDLAMRLLHPWLAAAVLGLALKPLLAWRMLRDETSAVEAALADSLGAGRARLSRLVSRDTSVLTASEVRESAIESLAENFNDSVIAPLFWFLLLGLPGAALYRFANTADAMWGYRGSRQGRCWEWAGKWTARADDLLSWLPARLSAALMLVGAPLAAWRALPAQARITLSPNGGWPMGAMALRLGVRLGKPGHYLLFPEGRVPQAADTAAALRCTGRIVLSIGLLALLGGVLP